MFSKSNLKKINLLIGALSVIIFMFGFFQVQWRGQTIVNYIPDIEITILSPIKSMLISLIGSEYAQLLNNIICLNIIWYVFVGFPVWIWNWVKEVTHID